MTAAELQKQAQEILSRNDKNGQYTIPASRLYPHQWLWDSCFIAIGLSHYNLDRAKQEVLSLFRGQWSNGMLPHMIFDNSVVHRKDRDMWRSRNNPYAPEDFATSGITQPPMVAEAVVRIGQQMSLPERRSWYQTVYSSLLQHHTWLYNERDPHGEGLVLLLHPWETGFDNTPPWMYELHQHQLALWIRGIKKLHLGPLLNIFRRDTHFVPPEQRLNVIDALGLYSVQRRMRRKAYDMNNMLSHSMFAIEDLTFNAILVRANKLLRDIARTIDQPLPEALRSRMHKTETAFEQLWDPYSSQYFSRSFLTHKYIKIPTIATLLPLYAGCITKERAAQLVTLLQNKKTYATHYPVPTTPIDSDWFREFGYWQGPTWINTNWLIADGLKRYGYVELAQKLDHSSLSLVGKSGFYEYFSPLSGQPAGIANFSWTAALTIDIINKYEAQPLANPQPKHRPPEPLVQSTPRPSNFTHRPTHPIQRS